jgi:hypothetical protein
VPDPGYAYAPLASALPEGLLPDIAFKGRRNAATKAAQFNHKSKNKQI